MYAIILNEGSLSTLKAPTLHESSVPKLLDYVEEWNHCRVSFLMFESVDGNYVSAFHNYYQ